MFGLFAIGYNIYIRMLIKPQMSNSNNDCLMNMKGCIVGLHDTAHGNIECIYTVVGTGRT